MTRKSAVQTSEVPGIGLDCRPRDYFWAAGLKIPLLSGIAGETRRQWVRELVEAGRPVPDGLDAPVLDEEVISANPPITRRNYRSLPCPFMFTAHKNAAQPFGQLVGDIDHTEVGRDDKAPAGPDFYFFNGGSVCLLRPITEAAKAWVDDCVCLDEWQSANSVAIEHRYVVDILRGIANDGLVVA